LKGKAGNYRELRAAIIFILKREPTVRISVPIHGNKPLKIGLIKHFMKVAGIDEGEL
jgi:hypothetical protein